jgi:hypothetical protein
LERSSLNRKPGPAFTPPPAAPSETSPQTHRARLHFVILTARSESPYFRRTKTKPAAPFIRAAHEWGSSGAPSFAQRRVGSTPPVAPAFCHFDRAEARKGIRFSVRHSDRRSESPYFCLTNTNARRRCVTKPGPKPIGVAAGFSPRERTCQNNAPSGAAFPTHSSRKTYANPKKSFPNFRPKLACQAPKPTTHTIHAK